MLPIVAITVSIISVITGVFAGLTFKYTPTKDEAVQKLKGFALGVLQWISNLIVLGILVYNVFFSNEPLTSVIVFTITLGVTSLIFTVTMFFITRIHKRMYTNIGKVYDDIHKMSNSIATVNERIGTVSESIGTVSEAIIATGEMAKLRAEEQKIRSYLLGNNEG